MKLLLTSNGLSNQSIADALIDLVGKKAEDITVAFIPTASNIIEGDKDWVIDDLNNIKKQNFESIDIVDISALDKEVWLPRLEEADVLFFEGGETYHLMKWLNKSGLAALLPEMLKTKVYVGLSAGSMVTNKDLALKLSEIIYDDVAGKTEKVKCLNFVDFYFLPHLNSSHFPRMRKENIEEVSKGISETIYALDDDSALKIVDGKIKVVSEGEYLVFN